MSRLHEKLRKWVDCCVNIFSPIVVKVRRLWVCLALQPCHVLVDQMGSSDLWGVCTGSKVSREDIRCVMVVTDTYLLLPSCRCSVMVIQLSFGSLPQYKASGTSFAVEQVLLRSSMGCLDDQCAINFVLTMVIFYEVLQQTHIEKWTWTLTFWPALVHFITKIRQICTVALIELGPLPSLQKANIFAHFHRQYPHLKK